MALHYSRPTIINAVSYEERCKAVFKSILEAFNSFRKELSPELGKQVGPIMEKAYGRLVPLLTSSHELHELDSVIDATSDILKNTHKELLRLYENLEKGEKRKHE
jgi:hypothetical protein